MINTTSCEMRWYGKHECKGQIEDRYYNIPGQSKDSIISYKVCKIEFSSTIFIGSKVRVNITGSHALSLVSSHGNIEVHSPFDISGSPSHSFEMHVNENTSVGGFVKIKEDGMDAGKASLRLIYTSYQLCLRLRAANNNRLWEWVKVKVKSPYFTSVAENSQTWDGRCAHWVPPPPLSPSLLRFTDISSYIKLHGKERSRKKDWRSHLEIELGTFRTCRRRHTNQLSGQNRPISDEIFTVVGPDVWTKLILNIIILQMSKIYLENMSNKRSTISLNTCNACALDRRPATFFFWPKCWLSWKYS